MDGNKPDILQGTLDLMVLKTLESMGPLHGYGIARRIEQVSGNTLILNQGTIYPRFCDWNSAAGSRPNGAFQSRAAAPASTPSPAPAGAASLKKPATGSEKSVAHHGALPHRVEIGVDHGTGSLSAQAASPPCFAGAASTLPSTKNSRACRHGPGRPHPPRHP